MSQKIQNPHDHADHAHVHCPGIAPCKLCRIEVDHLSVTAGNQVLLRDVNLHIHCGELTALIGANGAGKTTLLRALLGQVEYKGDVRHLTTDGRPAAAVRTGYVPQQLEFDRSSPVTVMDFMAASLSPMPVFLGVGKKTKEKVRAALARTHCEKLEKRPLGALSGGELQRVLLALDGACASGKTTLAAFLQKLYGCPLFHMDDFFLRPEQRTPERYAEPGGNVDRERFLAEVLIPLRAGETVQYRRFDCSTFTVLPPKPIAAGRLNVIEGTYSLHPDLEKQYDLSAVLKIPPDLQRERIIMRNGVEMAQRFFDTWIPLEERYFNALRPDLRCTMVLD